MMKNKKSKKSLNSIIDMTDIIKIFQIRTDPSFYHLEIDESEEFFNIPIIDKQGISYLTEKMITIDDIPLCLRNVNFNYGFDINFINDFKKSSINEFTILTLFFQLLSLMFISGIKIGNKLYCIIVEALNACLPFRNKGL